MMMYFVKYLHCRKCILNRSCQS